MDKISVMNILLRIHFRYFAQLQNLITGGRINRSAAYEKEIHHRGSYVILLQVEKRRLSQLYTESKKAHFNHTKSTCIFWKLMYHEICWKIFTKMLTLHSAHCVFPFYYLLLLFFGIHTICLWCTISNSYSITIMKICVKLPPLLRSSN